NRDSFFNLLSININYSDSMVSLSLTAQAVTLYMDMFIQNLLHRLPQGSCPLTVDYLHLLQASQENIIQILIQEPLGILIPFPSEVKGRRNPFRFLHPISSYHFFLTCFRHLCLDQVL